ncbi:hypothetical protein Tco_0533571 [Tanacetum coccineum]
MTWVEGTPAPLGLLWIGGERHEDVKFAIHGLCIDDSLVINARRRADSFVVFRLWLDIRLLSYSTVHNPWSSLIPLSRGSFDMIMGMDWLSKRKFMIVCHEKVVRVPLEGDEILRVHGERTLGAAKALMNAKLDKTKLSDISVKGRVKLRRVRAMSMTIQSSVKDKILVTSSKTSKEGTRVNLDGVPAMAMTFSRVRGMRLASPNKEWNSGDDQLRLRWMIYLVVLADAAESVRDTIGFEYCLASSSGWTKSPVLWAEIEESSLTGPELVLDTTYKVVLIKEKLKAARDHQKSYADKRRKTLEFEVGDSVLLKVSPLKALIDKICPGSEYVHDTFYVSNMKKCLADANLYVPLNEIKIDKTLRFVEELVEIMDREIRNLKRSKIPLVKVHWNSKCGPEFTWEREDHMKSKYPQLFVDRAVKSAS